MQFHIRVAHQQGLGIRVHRDELDALQPGVHHAVDRVRASAAHPHDLDHRKIAGPRVAHIVSNLQSHRITGLRLEPLFQALNHYFIVAAVIPDATSSARDGPPKRQYAPSPQIPAYAHDTTFIPP